MALTREEKTQQIDALTSSLENAKAVVFAEYRGINMKDNAVLRAKLKEAGVDYKVYKTTLLNIALKKLGLTVPEEILAKPIAIACSSEDEVVPAKTLVGAAKDIEALKVLGGIVNGVYSDETIMKQLAALPGREELYGKLVGTVSGPMYGLVGVLQGNIRGLLAVLKQYEAKKV